VGRTPKTARAARRAREREQLKTLRRAYVAGGMDPAEAEAVATIFWCSLPDDQASRDAEIEAAIRRSSEDSSG